MKALGYIANRIKSEKIDLQEEEIKLMNLIRIILDGGWVVDAKLL